MKQVRHFRIDTSAIALILANVLTIVFAVVQKWDITDVIWIYWAQSLIIGLFNFLRILDLENFSTEGYDDLRPRIKMNMKNQMALFFMFHYGLLHIVFLVFILNIWTVTPSVSAPIFALCILAFLITHGLDYWQNRPKTKSRKPNIGDIVFHPYARIMPMWFTLTVGIYLGTGSVNTLVLFLALKTIADFIMQILDPMNTSMTDIEGIHSTSSSEAEDEPLKTSKVDIHRQNQPVNLWSFWWHYFRTVTSPPYGLQVHKSWQGILLIIVLTSFVILLIYTVIIQ